MIHTYDMKEISYEAHTIMEDVAKVYNINKDPDTKKTYYGPRMYLENNVSNFGPPHGSGTA